MGYNTHVVPGYHLIGKKEAEAEPAVVLPYAGLAGYPYAGVGYPYAAVAPAVTYSVPKVETEVVPTNAAVPVAVGGYKAVAGDNGELKGAVHEVPALFGAPALNTQTNEASQGSLTVGTSALVTAEVTATTPVLSLGTISLARGRPKLTLLSSTLPLDTTILPTLLTLVTPLLEPMDGLILDKLFF